VLAFDTDVSWRTHTLASLSYLSTNNQNCISHLRPTVVCALRATSFKSSNCRPSYSQ